MTGFLRFVLLLVAVMCVTADDKSVEIKGQMAGRQESSAKEKNKNGGLAKILEDLRTLDHHDLKKVHKILMKGRILRKLNKALRKEADKKMGNKNILTQLRASDAMNGEKSELNTHELKRYMHMALGKRPALEKLELAFKKSEIGLEEKPATNGKSDEKETVDDKAHKNA